jgi:hypothetical protein
VPRALVATGHRGVVYRDPYGVALIAGRTEHPDPAIRGCPRTGSARSTSAGR